MPRLDAPLRHALLATLAVALAAVVFFAVFPSGTLWSGLDPADCAEYCEASHRCVAVEARPSIQQPLNTWSNLGFVFIGALALARRRDAASWIFAFGCAVLGAGSFLFHASLMRPLQWLDVVGMYTAIGALAARGVHDAAEAPWRTVVPGYALAMLGLAIWKWAIPTTAAMLLLGLVAAAALVSLRRQGRGSTRLALLPLALIAAGYLVRESDVRRLLCWPDSVVYQGHALWHLLSAASLHAGWLAFEAARDPGAGGPLIRAAR